VEGALRAEHLQLRSQGRSLRRHRQRVRRLARIGEPQLAWLKSDLAGQGKDARIVVFAHRPLFDLMPQWDWATRDGAQAIELLMPYRNVTVFYGHIHRSITT